MSVKFNNSYKASGRKSSVMILIPVFYFYFIFFIQWKSILQRRKISQWNFWKISVWKFQWNFNAKKISWNLPSLSEARV